MHRFVYLDTQDYSRFADAISGRGDERLIPIYEQLKKFAREGAFTFCFSYMIVSELLQFNQQDLEITRRKAEVVEELCDAKAFPVIFWLLAAELSAVAQRRGFMPDRRLCTLDEVVFDGQWIRVELSQLEAALQGFDKKVEAESKAMIRKALGRLPNRNERRRVAKRTSMEEARKLVLSAEIYPVIANTKLVDRFARALIEKRLPDFTEEFFRFVARPSRLVLSHNHFHSMSFLNEQTATLKQRLFAALTRLRDDYDALQQAHGKKNRTERAAMLRGPLENYLESMAMGLRNTLLRYGTPNTYFESNWFGEDVRSLPFISLWGDLLMPYLLMVTDDGPTRRSLQPSDMIDFMHALYIPHCTVWRSDKYFTSLVAPLAQQRGCRVVSKLVDLPKVLTEILESELPKPKLAPPTFMK